MMSVELLRMLISQCVQVAFLACVVWLITRHWTKQRSHLNHALWARIAQVCDTASGCEPDKPVLVFCRKLT